MSHHSQLITSQKLGFEAVDGWPAEHVALTVGADRFAGVNNDGTWYEKFGINGGEYYYDLLATEGLYAEALGAQALAAGFLYEEDYKVYFDAKGNAEAEFDPDNDAYLTMQEKDGKKTAIQRTLASQKNSLPKHSQKKIDSKALTLMLIGSLNQPRQNTQVVLTSVHTESTVKS